VPSPSPTRRGGFLRRASREAAFTVVGPLAAVGGVALGLLVSIVLLGLLAHSGAWSDASARTDVQSAVAQIESCYATRQDYRQCTTAHMLTSGGLSLGVAPGQVHAYAPSQTSYSVIATASAPGPSGRGHATYGVFKTSAGMVRTCNRPGVGGCSFAGRW
jgi:hypothetical protein